MSFQIHSVPKQHKLMDSVFQRVRGDLQGVKGPTKYLSASLLLMTPTSVQLGDTWILKTVASGFQLDVMLVRFMGVSRVQMSMLLCMIDPCCVLAVCPCCHAV